MNSRRIRMPITHHTPKARVGVVEQCLGLNQVVEGGVGGIGIVSSAHASPASATASLYFLLAWYCSALPPR